MEDEPPAIIQHYKGKDAHKQYERSAALLAQRGYYPVAQSTLGGGFSAGDILAFGRAVSTDRVARLIDSLVRGIGHNDMSAYLVNMTPLVSSTCIRRRLGSPPRWVSSSRSTSAAGNPFNRSSVQYEGCQPPPEPPDWTR